MAASSAFNGGQAEREPLLPPPVPILQGLPTSDQGELGVLRSDRIEIHYSALQESKQDFVHIFLLE